MADRLKAETKVLFKTVSAEMRRLQDLYRQTGNPDYQKKYNLLTGASGNLTPENYKVLSPYMSDWLKDYSKRYLDK